MHEILLDTLPDLVSHPTKGPEPLNVLQANVRGEGPWIGTDHPESNRLQNFGLVLMPRPRCYCVFPLEITRNKRADERTRTADLISLRVISHVLQRFAKVFCAPVC